ncbi:type IV toxin-antitoxin system AbiEi family antitoxin domain-containing protein [Agromyces mediolanus]|uniref:DUF559 domain-containing protein n=1 Tax=Agromyces mediolanus TaxID=41986 RepID=UPI003838DA67
MDLADWLRSNDGIAHRRRVDAAGFTRTAITRAIDSGRIVRIRSRWLATPDAAHSRKADAARAGGRLSCASAAQELGLWAFPDPRLHLAVPPHSGRSSPAATRHWSLGPLAAHPHELVEPPENVLVHAAECLPSEQSLVIWESAVRTGLVNLAAMARLPIRSRRATALLETCSELSDSGLESLFVARLRNGGIRVRQQVPVLGHRVDALIGDRLVCQLDGFAHHSGAADRRRDLDHDRRLTLAGYTVLRFDYARIMFEWPLVEQQVRLALAQTTAGR